MNDIDTFGGAAFGLPAECGQTRDLLPLWSAGSGDPHLRGVEAHLASCADCRAEAELVQRLRTARPEPPAGLARDILDRHAEARRAVRRSRWGAPVGLSAAAVAAALAVGLFASARIGTDPVWDLALDPEPSAWYGEEWLIAGGPVPDALPDDVLQLLLQEMEQ